MNTGEEQIRALIARQAGDWFEAHRDGHLDASERRAFREWLLASPVHVEEYLGVAAIARALPTAADDPEHTLEAILARADAAADSTIRAIGPNDSGSVRGRPVRLELWHLAAAAVLVVVVGGLLWWGAARPAPQHYATRHGERGTWRLGDNSVLRLNTDTAVTVRYGGRERRVDIEHGQAFFVVAQDPQRRFRVVAGSTDVIAVGTQFDVYRQGGSTAVTVVEGHVRVGSEGAGRQLGVSAGEQVWVTGGSLPERATPVDAQRSTSWLNGRIAFDHEALAAVAAEFNRYGAVPIEIESPALRALVVSGVFAADDTETFLSFLRSLRGVTVETTPAAIRVFKSPDGETRKPQKAH